MKHPCSLCGSRDWPNEDTDCPLCWESPETLPDLPVELFEDAVEHSCVGDAPTGEFHGTLAGDFPRPEFGYVVNPDTLTGEWAQIAERVKTLPTHNIDYHSEVAP